MKHTTLPKGLCPSLSVPSLQAHPGIVRSNAERLTEAPVLVLVTGAWAQEYSLAAFMANYHPVLRTHERIAPVRYDHLERLSAQSDKCSELTSEFKSVHFYSTMAHYTQGEDHAWRLADCIPFLSDMVVLPRVLEMAKLQRVMRFFHRAIRKSLKDSVYVAGSAQYREESLHRMSKPPFPELIRGTPPLVVE